MQASVFSRSVGRMQIFYVFRLCEVVHVKKSVCAHEFSFPPNPKEFSTHIFCLHFDTKSLKTFSCRRLVNEKKVLEI